MGGEQGVGAVLTRGAVDAVTDIGDLIDLRRVEGAVVVSVNAGLNPHAAAGAVIDLKHIAEEDEARAPGGAVGTVLTVAHVGDFGDLALVEGAVEVGVRALLDAGAPHGAVVTRGLFGDVDQA